MRKLNFVNDRINLKPLEFIRIAYPEKNINSINVSKVVLNKSDFSFTYITDLGDNITVTREYNNDTIDYIKNIHNELRSDAEFYNNLKTLLNHYGSENIIFGGSFCMSLLGILNRDKIKDFDFILLGDTSKYNLISSKRDVDDKLTAINILDHELTNDDKEFDLSLHGEFIDEFNVKSSVVKSMRSNEEGIKDIPHDIFIYDDITVLGDDYYMTVKYKDLYVNIFNLKTFCITKRVFMETIKNQKSISKHMTDFEYIEKLVKINYDF